MRGSYGPTNTAMHGMNTPHTPTAVFPICAQVERLADLRNMQSGMDGEDGRLCELFPFLKSPRDRATSLRSALPLEGALGVEGWALDPSDPNRAWLYQTCTEFGFFQASCPEARCYC